MVGNEYLRESQDLSITIEEVFNSSLKKIDKLNLGVGQANFWVLNGAFMPSVLVEVGFISNPHEEKTLKDELFQNTMASAMFDALMQFKKKIESGR
jgi:N-acetylmuramoyl-L-alanine amidase